MTRYRVHGIHRDTGSETSCTVTAQNEDDAVRLANKRGLVVERATPEGEVADIDYANPKLSASPPRFEPPKYRGLAVASTICTIVGGLYLATVGICAVGVVLGVIRKDQAGLELIASMVSGAFIAAFGSAIMFGIAAACDALRDIARNSWRQ